MHLIALIPWLLAAGSAEPPYAERLHAALQKSPPAWLVQAGQAAATTLQGRGGAASLMLEIDATGAVRKMRLGHSSGSNLFDDWAQHRVLAAEPFAPPPAAEAETCECVVRVALAAEKKSTVETHVACFKAGQPLGDTAALPPATAQDAGAKLFLGMAREAAGDLSAAMRLYQEAASAAPDWDLAGRALGLALVHAKRPAEAVPYLKTYVLARSGAADAAVYAREIKRFEEQQAQRLAEARKPRVRLSPQDIAMGVRKGYALLEPCLREARAKRILAEGTDTLLLTWNVQPDGTVTAPQVEGPKIMTLTEQAECLEQAVGAWQFPPFTQGQAITVKSVPIKVIGSPPPAATASLAPTAPPTSQTPAEPPDEPTFSTCERRPAEISVFLRSRMSRLDACLQAQKSREPQAPLPERLTVNFVVDISGAVRNVRLNHRFYRDGLLATCVGEALIGTMPPSGGADCPAEFNLAVPAGL